MGQLEFRLPVGSMRSGQTSAANTKKVGLAASQLGLYRDYPLTWKIENAHVSILKALEMGKEPRLLCSFGKDSTVMVDLLSHYGIRKVLFLYDADEAVDWDHIQTVVDKYKLDLIPLSKGRSLFYVIDDIPMLLSFPYINRSCMLPMPTNIDNWRGTGEFVCIDNQLRVPYGPVLEDDGDLMFLGQKITDLNVKLHLTVVDSFIQEDQEAFAEKIARQGDIFEIGPGLPGCSPLKFWSDNDVWNYIEEKELPWSRKVYKDRKRLPHTYPCCYRCHDPNGPVTVECPIMNRGVPNFCHFTKDVDLELEKLVRMGLITTKEKEGALNAV